MDGDIKVT